MREDPVSSLKCILEHKHLSVADLVFEKNTCLKCERICGLSSFSFFHISSLKNEAERRGISPEQLLEKIIGGDREISGEEKKEIIVSYANRLNDRYEVEIFLQKPSLPLTQVDIKDRPASGPEDASVVVVEFSDPFCPACRTAPKTTSKIKEAYVDQIRWVFEDFPLDIHQHAKKAAEAFHCAEEQGKFWQYHDRVVSAKEENVDAGELVQYAESRGLDKQRFTQCLQNGTYRS